jgi:hypothetical protein
MGKGGPSARSRVGLTGALLAGMKRENSKVPAVGQLHNLKQSRTDLRSQRTKRMHQILSVRICVCMFDPICGPVGRSILEFQSIAYVCVLRCALAIVWPLCCSYLTCDIAAYM